MDNNNLPSPRVKKTFNSFVTHLMCQCLLWTQILLGPQILADEATPAPTPTPDYDQVLSDNEAHVERADENGGTISYCEDDTNIYNQLDTMNTRLHGFTKRSHQDISNQIDRVNDSLVGGDGAYVPNLMQEQQAFMEIDGGFAGENSMTDAQKDRWNEARQRFSEASDVKHRAERKLDRARDNCPNPMTCSASAQSALTQAQNEYDVARNAYSAAYEQYRIVRNEVQGGSLDSINDAEDPFFAKEQEYRDTRVAYEDAVILYNAADMELQSARNDCDEYCSTAERERLNRARVNFNQATIHKNETLAEYNAAKEAWKNAPRGMADASEEAYEATSGNANAMQGSHQVSGCGYNFDITTNTDTECALSGPLFEQDQELTNIANANMAYARQLASQRSRLLFTLELGQQFNADYRLYKEAIAPTDKTTNARSRALTQSNSKTLGLASAAVKDMVCEQHDESEVDSKSYHIFRAAAATWLMAVVNDTEYYSSQSQCRAIEELTEDTNNEQVQAIERAANLSEQQMQSLCMRVQPMPPEQMERFKDGTPAYNPSNPDHWQYFGSTEQEAARNVLVIRGYTDPDSGQEFPPLKERCLAIYEEIRGGDYDDKPATREYARDMVAEALLLAVEELAAKRGKIGVAHANVEKGKAWVKRVKRDIMIMMALAAVVFAAYQAASNACSGCGPHCSFCCSMCPVASALNSKYVYITGTVIAVWLMSELMRAQSFLAKWKEKLEKAKYFHHLACNFEDAQAEKDIISGMVEEANQRRLAEMDQREQEVINSINSTVYRSTLINNNSDESSESVTDETTSIDINTINRLIKRYDSEQEITNVLSLLLFKKSESDIYSLNEALTSLGLELVKKVMPNATADEQQPIADTRENRRDQNHTANALNISSGTKSFQYFLVQRNAQYMNLTADITNQPEHIPSDSLISSAGGSNPKNKEGSVIKTIDQLAAPFMGGDGSDPIASITDENKTGFPTPETRVATIQAALDMFNDNIMRLNGGIGEVVFQRDQTTQLLDEARRRLNLGSNGLGVTQLIPNTSGRGQCMANAPEGIRFDSSCGCQKDNSCKQFEYPSFDPVVPSALKNGGRLSTDTANAVLSGNLGEASFNGGKLANNAANVRTNLFKAQEEVNKQRSKAGLGPRNIAAESQSLISSTEDEIGDTLSKMGVDTANSGSSFGNVRNDLLNSDINSSAATNSNQNISNQASSSRSSAMNKAADVNENGTKSESFSLGDSNGSSNLDMSELTDEEKRRLGLLGGAGDNLGPQDNEGLLGNDRYGHVRNVSKANKNPNDPFYDINKNRSQSLFGIISERYEKSAFPVLLKRAPLK